jgi:protein TonB
MKYQSIGLQISLLIHTLIFMIGFGYSHFSTPASAPIPIEFGILSNPELAPVKVAQRHKNQLQHTFKETIKPAQQPETLSQTAVSESPMPKREETPPQTVTDESLKADQTALNASIAGPVFNADYLHNPKPPYPLIARRLKLEGTVIVKVLVSSEGKPEIIRLETSSGSNVLDQAALNAVQGWTFVPAKQGNQPVTAWVGVPIRFRLSE